VVKVAAYISRSYQILLLIAVFISSGSGLAKDYDILGTVSPDFGYGDTTFNYSARIQLLGDTSTFTGKWQVELKIYNGSDECGSERRPPNPRILGTREWIAKLTEPIPFDPKNFERDFVIKSTDNASFEFIVYRDGSEVARKRLLGPEVRPPYLLGDPSYNKQPYFVESFQVVANFKDKLKMSPNCYLELRGPLGSPDEGVWETREEKARASETTYTFSMSVEDLSRFREGGNFSFNIVYSNGFTTVRAGPYSVRVLPYKPSIDLIDPGDPVDRTNFSIKAYVDDVGKRLEGESFANITITNAKNAQRTLKTNYSQPQLVRRGGKDYLLFEWTQNEISFDRRDVELSKSSPFQAKVHYRNDRWNYDATGTSRPFRVIEERPILSVKYNKTLYVREGESADYYITAQASYSKGMGELWLNLVGKDRNITEPFSAVDLGGGRYIYSWSGSFDSSSRNNTYTFLLSYVHPSLEDGRYPFPEKYTFTVQPISVRFRDPSVNPIEGRWNGTYTYSVTINSTLSGLASLEVWDPCIKDWTAKGEQKRISAWDNRLTWTLRPFDQECPNMKVEPPMYRFKAALDRIYYSNASDGPYVEPTIKKPVVYSHSVSPLSGTYDAGFNYSITLYSEKRAPIELQIIDPQHDQYESLGTKEYATPGRNQTLAWSHSFSREFEGRTLGYRFRYQGTDLVTGNGPRIVLGGIPRIYNASVNPQNGSYNASFEYNVTLGFVKQAPIDLQVYYPAPYNKWESSGLNDYTSPGKNQTLVWEKTFDDKRLAGKALSYRLMYGDQELGNYDGPKIDAIGKENVTQPTAKDGTEPGGGPVPGLKPPVPQPNNTTKLNESDFLRLVSKYGIGRGGGGGISQENFLSLLTSMLPKVPPDILRLLGGQRSETAERPALKSAWVTPDVGNWTDEFTYEARIQNKNDSAYTLGLDVYMPGTKSWEKLDYKDVRRSMYDKEHVASVVWRYKGFTPDDVGNSSSFKVYYYDQFNSRVPLTGEVKGPVNITRPYLHVDGRVSPNSGSCKMIYNYTVMVYNPSKGKMKVGLEVLLPGSGEWYPVGEKSLYPSRYDRNCTAYLTWNIRPFTVDDVNRSSQFRVSYEDERQNYGIVERTGPDLINIPPRILRTWVEPPSATSRESFTYHAVVQDSNADELLANLIIYDPEIRSTLTRMGQGVRGSDAGRGEELIWPFKFQETYQNKTFLYNVTASDGVAEVATGNLSGPEILALPTITVEVLPLESQSFNWWDEYTFKVRVDNPSPLSSIFTPAFLTSRGWIYLQPKTVSQTSGPETKEWTFSEFTANDRSKPIRYAVTFTLPDQYGRFSRDSMVYTEKRVSDVMMSNLMAALNVLWIALLGGIVYIYSGRIDQLIRMLGREKQ
jgi:hypothetical protein